MQLMREVTAPDGPSARSWSVQVYQTDTGLCAVVEYRTNKDHERTQHRDLEAATLPELMAALTDFAQGPEVDKWVTGFPPGEKYREQRTRVVNSLRLSLLGAVAKLSNTP